MSGPLHLFEALGIEVEYAIVDADTLDVRPIADRLMETVAGDAVSELERGAIAWSNELALHVLELKTHGPAAELGPLPALFHEELRIAEEALARHGARLMPGAMHPWMDPSVESRLWPHEYNDVYRAFDRIFGCSGHGWTNLQSVHVNLPFHGDEEFAPLHAAIRLILPLAPALAAASPVADGRPSGALDTRLVAYMRNSRRVPSVAGLVVPEPMASRDEYEREILGRIYRDLEPHDPEGVLRHEWANARGAIARFERGSIEIRLLDSQESPSADIALAAAVGDVVRWVAENVPPAVADGVPTELLAHVLEDTVRDAERVEVPAGIRRPLGVRASTTAGRLWGILLDRAADRAADVRLAPSLERTLSRGPLARRILTALGPDPTPETLRAVYARLCDCLRADSPFEPGGA